MKIIISDENEIWTPDHPALEPFADHVLVFCLNGIRTSEKYQCIVTEYHPMGLGMSCGLHSAKYRSLKAASNRLINCIDYHEDIVFLTDKNPDGLYPYLAVSSMNYWKHLHLVTMTPWGFEPLHKQKAHRAFLEDLSSISSLVVLNNVMSDIKMHRGITLPDLIQEAKVRCGELLPMILYQIQERNWEKAFFNFHTMQYTPLEEGYDLSNAAPLHPPTDFTIDDIELDPYNEGTMGLIELDELGLDDESLPEGSHSYLNRVESLVPRVDGKRVCEYLRGLRTKLAEANGIPFESPQCPSIGPCAGTCDKCDEELAWLMAEIDRLEPDQRIYPKDILKDWRVAIYGLQEEITPEVDNKDVTLRCSDLQRDIKSLLSYAVGCMFGRYSISSTGLIFVGGKWNIDKYTEFKPDSDNVIPITDEEYLGDDIISRLCIWLKVVYGEETLEENLNFIAKALGNKGSSSREIIRNYFLNDFFKDHCQTYSVTGSGKRPIYWLFDSGKQNGFKALIYLHRYNADTIGNLRIDYLHRMQRIYESEINRMQDMIDHSTNAREAAQATKRREKLTKQLKECREYDEKLAHLALSRIELDLDDGVKVNYRKLQTASDGKFYEVLADSKNIMSKK